MFANKYPAVILGPQNTVNNFFQILWNSRCDILVTFPSHLKKSESLQTEGRHFRSMICKLSDV